MLVKNWATLRSAYFKKADYLNTTLEHDGRLNFNEHTFQLSRNAKSLKIWMSLKMYGIRQIRKMIQKDIDLTHYLSNQIETSDDFELKSRFHLAVCWFGYIGKRTREEVITKLNQQLILALEKDGRIFITGTKLNGDFVIRACIINHRKQKEDIDYLLTVIRDVAKSLE